MEQESAKPPKSPAKKAALSLTIHKLQKNPNRYERGVTLLLEVQREAGSIHPAAPTSEAEQMLAESAGIGGHCQSIRGCRAQL